MSLILSNCSKNEAKKIRKIADLCITGCLRRCQVRISQDFRVLGQDKLKILKKSGEVRILGSLVRISQDFSEKKKDADTSRA